MAGFSTADSFFTPQSRSVVSSTAHSPERNADALLGEFDRLHTRVYNGYIAAIQADDRYYRRKYGQNVIPKAWKTRGFKETVPATAYDAVETLTDHVLTTPDIQVPTKETEFGWAREQLVSDRKKSYLDYFWYNVALKGNPLRRLVKKGVKDGRMIFKKEIDWQRVDLKGVRLGRNGFMYNVKCLPNETVYVDEDNPDDPRFVFETYMVRVDSAKRMFPNAGGAWRENGPDFSVRLIEYWEKPSGKSKGKRIVWVENERVLNKINPYHWVWAIDDTGADLYDGYIPYFVGDTGWGDDNEDRLPEDRYVGVIRHMRDVLDAEVRQLSAADAQLRVSTFPITKAFGMNPDDVAMKMVPGEVINFSDKDRQNIEIFQMPDVPPGVWEILNRYTRYANNTSKADALGGGAQRGVDTATEADQNNRNAASKMTGLIDALRTVIIKVNATLLQDVELVLEAPVTTYGSIEGTPGVVTLSPEDIDGFYETFVELKTSDQASLQRAEAMMWANLYQVLRLDRGFAMKQAGIKNPMERVWKRSEEDVFDDPRSHDLRLMQSLQGKGPVGETLAAAALATAASGNMPEDDGKGGSFAGNGDPAATPREPTGEGIRASAFGQALDQRPDLSAQ